jgi:hypothetical protein
VGGEARISQCRAGGRQRGIGPGAQGGPQPADVGRIAYGRLLLKGVPDGEVHDGEHRVCGVAGCESGLDERRHGGLGETQRVRPHRAGAGVDTGAVAMGEQAGAQPMGERRDGLRPVRAVSDVPATAGTATRSSSPRRRPSGC